MNRASKRVNESEEEHDQIKAILDKLYKMFDITDFVDENGDGILDNIDSENSVDDGIEIIE